MGYIHMIDFYEADRAWEFLDLRGQAFWNMLRTDDPNRWQVGDETDIWTFFSPAEQNHKNADFVLASLVTSNSGRSGCMHMVVQAVAAMGLLAALLWCSKVKKKH